MKIDTINILCLNLIILAPNLFQPNKTSLLRLKKHKTHYFLPQWLTTLANINLNIFIESLIVSSTLQLMVWGFEVCWIKLVIALA